MSMIPWEPMSEMVFLRNAMDRLFENSSVGLREWEVVGQEIPGMIPLDIRAEGNNLIIQASVPGAKPEEMDVHLQGTVLIISVERKQESEHKEHNYYYRKLHYGRFERRVTLPCAVQASKAEAIVKDGVLTLKAPKAKEIRVKRVQVRVKK